MEQIIETLQLRRAGGKCYLIDTADEKGPYHKPVMVNEMGAEFFLQLKKGKSREETSQRIAAEYGVDEKKVREDLDRFLKDLTERHIIWK
mgnify:CR=1 FL=1